MACVWVNPLIRISIGDLNAHDAPIYAHCVTYKVVTAVTVQMNPNERIRILLTHRGLSPESDAPCHPLLVLIRLGAFPGQYGILTVEKNINAPSATFRRV